MATHDLTDLTWEEVRGATGDRCAALLPVGAIEAHGPHLPLGTDLIIADAWTRRAADRLAGRGVRALRLPVLAFTPAGFAGDFAGTISLDPALLAGTVVGIATELRRHGVAALGIASAHLDPANLEALRDAARDPRLSDGPAIAFPDLSRKPWALRLGDEFRSGACHAGRFETSIVLAVRPDLVRDPVRRSLPPVPASLSAAIREGKRTFEAAGGSRAYFGWPADATADEGRTHLETLSELLADAVLEALGVSPQ
jgi:creatinine amidohydrolase